MPNKTLAYPPPDPKPLPVLRAILRAVFRLLYRFEYTGGHNLPAIGPVLLAPNHSSYLDPIIAAIGQDRPMCFMAWDALFSWRWFAAIIRALGAFPVNLKRPEVASYRTALACLREGKMVLIFPEGGRSDDGRLLPLRDGVAHLALTARVPIVPVAIRGSREAWPRERKLPYLFRKITVHYCPPVYPPEPAAQAPDAPGALEDPRVARAQAQRELLDQVRRRLIAGGAGVPPGLPLPEPPPEELPCVVAGAAVAVAAGEQPNDSAAAV